MNRRNFLRFVKIFYWVGVVKAVHYKKSLLYLVGGNNIIHMYSPFAFDVINDMLRLESIHYTLRRIF